MFKDQSLYTLVNILAPCIVDLEIEVITRNSLLKFANNDINLVILDKFIIKNLNRM